MAVMEDEALAEIANGLYAKPMEDFVPARAAAAKEVAGANKELGAAVRALPKPSVAAWAVNMLALHQPEVLAGLADLGTRMRAAQASLDAAALRELGRERRTLLAAAVDTARSVAQEHGRSISDAMTTDVEETLRALTADEGAAAAVQSGRLLKTISADGVNAVELEGSVAVPAALPAQRAAPAPSKTPVRKEQKESTTAAGTARTKPDKPRLEAVRQAPRPRSLPALDKAQAALAEAQAAEAETAQLAKNLQNQADETRTEIAGLIQEASGLRAQLKAVEDRLEQSRKRLASTTAEAKQAQRAADKAERTAMLAQERVLRLGR
jgi:chromosome segregation ATPase